MSSSVGAAGLTPQACNPIRWTRRRDDPPTPKTPSSSITQVAGSGTPPGMGRSQMGWGVNGEPGEPGGGSSERFDCRAGSPWAR